MTGVTASEVLLEAVGVTKHFAGVTALSDFSLTVHGGGVHALVGENGAGKSTFIKILAGAYAADGGRLLVDGVEREIASPAQASDAGFAFVHQQASSVPLFTVAEELTHRLLPKSRVPMLVNRRQQRDVAAAVLKKLRLDVDPATPMAALSPPAQQMVAIGRALVAKSRLLVLDEPTASLSAEETRTLFGVIEELVADGVSILYVSHRLDEIFQIAQRVTVLRDGRLVATEDVKGLTKSALVKLIIGREPEEFFRRPSAVEDDQPVVLKATGLTDGLRVRDATFEIRRGELVGVAGLVGAGRSELASLIFGSSKARGGDLEIRGVSKTFRSPGQAIRAGVALLPEDRRQQGAVLDLSIAQNIALASLRKSTRSRLPGLVSLRLERERAERRMGQLGIKARSPQQPLSELSGGNQQKVIFAKWLDTEPEILILDEPTQGIDVGAKAEIYRIINDLVARGRTVVFISSDLEEVSQVCPRVLVMREGVVVADLVSPSEAQILQYCFGVAS
jgi:ABC-type sugar transport system ATPase subunit